LGKLNQKRHLNEEKEFTNSKMVANDESHKILGGGGESSPLK